MKKAILMAALATFTFGAFAQTAQPSNGLAVDTAKKHHKHHKKGGDTATKMLDTAKKM